MPRGLHFDRINDPIRICSVVGGPLGGRKRVIAITLQIYRGSLAKSLPDGRIARAVDDRIDIHVAGEMRSQLGSLTGQDINYAARKITRCEDLRKGKGHERESLAYQDNARISREDDRCDQGDHREQGRRIRANDGNHAGRLGKGEIEMR